MSNSFVEVGTTGKASYDEDSKFDSLPREKDGYSDSINLRRQREEGRGGYRGEKRKEIIKHYSSNNM